VSGIANKDWENLNNLQLGRYAEYYAKMEFASYGCQVYTTEVDDHGVDFVVKDKNGRYCEIQVKSIRSTGYVFMEKSKFDLSNHNLFVTLLVFHKGELPDIFLIPACTWKNPNQVFVDRDYDKPGQTSKPEYGINVSKKNYDVLQNYAFEDAIREFV
jgi:hypothetical protein